MIATRTEFNKFLDYLAESLDIPETRYRQAEERYTTVGEWLKREGSSVALYAPEIYTQGSFRLGTAVKPFTETEEYDIDLVCELKRYLVKGKITQKQLKTLLGSELRSYVETYKIKSPLKEKQRCWRLDYADSAPFHMDVLPSIPDGESYRTFLAARGLSNNWANSALAITDNACPNYDRLDYDWPRSNPKGYAEWFKERMKVQYVLRKKHLAESIRASVEQIPDYKVKTPLQRAVQILKRHRDIMFADDHDDKPISIIITTLAAHAYNNEADLEEALIKIVSGMSRFILEKDGSTMVLNPVDPLENFADKWQKYPEREVKFRFWLTKIQADLEAALQSEHLYAAAETLKPRFGERVINEALQHFPQPVQAKTGLIPTAMSRLVSLFKVSHRQAPQWPIVQRGQVTITGWASREGFRPQQFKSDSTALPKRCSLRFEAMTNIPRPFKVYWQVVNTGHEALAAKGLRGGFYEGILERGGLVREECTQYTGPHWIECFIVKDNICVARSGEYVVNIQ